MMRVLSYALGQFMTKGIGYFPHRLLYRPRFRAMELSKVMRGFVRCETLMPFTGAERFFAPNFG